MCLVSLKRPVMGQIPYIVDRKTPREPLLIDTRSQYKKIYNSGRQNTCEQGKILGVLNFSKHIEQAVKSFCTAAVAIGFVDEQETYERMTVMTTCLSQTES